MDSITQLTGTALSRIFDTLRTAKKVGTLASAAILATACGGGGGGGGEPLDSSPEERAPSPIDNPGPAPDNSAFYSISGTVTSAAAIDVDSDLNDPNSPYVDNSVTYQEIDNIVTLHGFASAVGTASAGIEGRFVDEGDAYDIFKVHLQQGQRIQLHITEYSSFDLATTGDLDLSLWSSDGQLLDLSNGTDEYELLQVQTTGDYLIAVEAFEGISKYVLRILPSSGYSSTARRKSMNFVPGEMIVKHNPVNSAGQTTKAAVRSLTLTHKDQSRSALAQFSTMSAQAQAAGVDPLRVPLGSNAEREKHQTLRRIKAANLQPGVEFAEPNYYAQPSVVPNDEYYSFQWHYPQINLPQAWDITTGSTGVEPAIVAVIDTGVYLNHPDMQGQLVDGYDFIRATDKSLDGDGIDSDADDPGDSVERGKSSFHGTHVAGTVAARSNDGSGVAGVAWGAKIMPVRVLGNGGGTTYDILQGILFAGGLANDSGTVPARRADIINLSLGGAPGDPPLQSYQDAFDAVRGEGVIVVAAAGNDNSNLLAYPASYDGVVSVSAVDSLGKRAPYSNSGARIDIAAPGGDIGVDLNGDGYNDGVLSAGADDAGGSRVASYPFYNGTSMAAPHVAGVAALMKSVNPALSPNDFDALLQNGELTDDAGDSGRDDIFGYGIINAYKAVIAAQQLSNGGSVPEPAPSIVANPSNIAFDQGSVFDLAITNQGGGSPVLGEIQNTASWLSVEVVTVDANNFGTYRLSANRSGLGDGYYRTSLEVIVDGMRRLSIQVTLQVGAVGDGGKIATQYVQLADPETLQPLALAQTTAVSEGVYSFRFDAVPPGEYELVSGSDIDNDAFICQSGESCGAYPSLIDYEPLQVESSDIEGLNFTVDVLGSISSGSAQSASVAKRPQGITRLPAPAITGEQQ